MQKNVRRLVLRKIEQQFEEDFKVFNNYAMELRATNPGSNVVVVSGRQSQDALPIFQKMYICLTAVREGFLVGCRRLIGLDGCFLKGLMKGQLLVAVGRDGNNHMFPIACAVVEKETYESWTWFLQQLKLDLGIEDGLGWSIVSDMQKVSIIFIEYVILIRYLFQVFIFSSCRVLSMQLILCCH